MHTHIHVIVTHISYTIHMTYNIHTRITYNTYNMHITRAPSPITRLEAARVRTALFASSLAQGPCYLSLSLSL